MDKQDMYFVGMGIGAALVVASKFDLNTVAGANAFVDALYEDYKNNDDGLKYLFDGIAEAVLKRANQIKKDPQPVILE